MTVLHRTEEWPPTFVGGADDAPGSAIVSVILSEDHYAALEKPAMIDVTVAATAPVSTETETVPTESPAPETPAETAPEALSGEPPQP